jgi:hypothetical protein
MTTLTPPWLSERSILAVPVVPAAQKMRFSGFLRSVGDFGSMARRAYGAGVAYEAAASPSARQRVLSEFLSDVNQAT